MRLEASVRPVHSGLGPPRGWVTLYANRIALCAGMVDHGRASCTVHRLAGRLTAHYRGGSDDGLAVVVVRTR